MSPVTGQIDNRYSVIRMLGEGFTGEVYLVESSEGRFALKLLKPFSDRRLEESIIRAFKFEFGFLKDLRHPNVVRIQDFGFDDTLRRFYFTEEYLDGKPLNDFCKGASPELIGNLFIQSIEGLQAIHRAHILHGDLKGSNLLVIEEEGGPVIKIIDLGLSDPRFPFTAGTPSTMAPEKILKDHVDERSDLYSLGVVFYQIFTGSNPFIGKNVKETYQAHLALRPPKITLKNPQVPSYWNEIFDCLLEKNPAHRYRDAGALLEAIDFAKPQKAGKKKVKPWRPERWVGREKIVEEVSGKLKAFFEKKNGPAKVLLLLGEKGVGKSRIVQEVKYLFQMEKVEVFESKPGSLFPPSSEEPLLWVVDEGSRFSPEERSQILIKMEKNSPSWAALLSLLPEEGEDLLSDFEKKGVEVSSVTVRPFTREDLNEFLKELTDVKEVPDPFLDGLWEKTHGNPRLVIGLLEHLVADKRLVDARGHWNLSIFKEGGFDLRPLPLDLSEIDQALVILPAGDHKNRTELWIKRSEELLKKNLIDEASESLKKAEEETQKVQDLSQKLHFRSRIYEKEGWKLIREGHFDEAHNRMERALALLEESTVMDEVLEIRLHNFVAWLYCQEGKFDEAITLFEEQQRRAEKLPPAEQQRVLNNELGQAYLMKGDLKRAIFFLEAAFDFYEKVGDLPSRMKGLYNLAEAHAQAKDYSRAIQYYLKAAEMSRFHRNFELLLRAYNGLGKTFHLQGNYNEGLSYYERALELARYLEDYLSAAAIAQNIGSIQSERGDFEPADAHFELSLKMLRKLSQLNAHAKYLICRALLEKGDLYRKQKKFKDAEELIRDAFQLTQQESSLASFRFWVLYTQSQLERDQGNFEKLKDLMAELMPLADDGEKRDRCRELLQDKTMTPVVAPAEIHRTRAEAIPASPSRSGALEALIRVARWLASEKDPERLLPLIIRQATELSGAEARSCSWKTREARWSRARA
ncbi:MAG: tetratricopeptide repeat protein [bacterium]